MQPSLASIKALGNADVMESIGGEFYSDKEQTEHVRLGNLELDFRWALPFAFLRLALYAPVN